MPTVFLTSHNRLRILYNCISKMNNDSVCKQDSFLGILAVAILTFLPPWTLESFNGVTGGTLRRAESNVELSMQVNRVQLGMGNIKKKQKTMKGKVCVWPI